MNRFILTVFIVLSIFSSVQSFAALEELTDVERINQLLIRFNGYVETYRKSFNPIDHTDLINTSDFSIDTAIYTPAYLETLVSKIHQAETIHELLIKSFSTFNQDLEFSIQIIFNKIKLLDKNSVFSKRLDYLLSELQTILKQLDLNIVIFQNWDHPVKASDIESINELTEYKIKTLIWKSYDSAYLLNNLYSEFLYFNKKFSYLFQQIIRIKNPLEEATYYKNSSIPRSKDLSYLPIFQTKVFDTPKKYLKKNIRDSLIKYFEESHPFTQDPKITPVSLETLTIRQLIIIVNKYLTKERALYYSIKYFKYFSQMGVPEEILIKMFLNYGDSVEITSLKAVFNSTLYNKFLKFLDQYNKNHPRFPNSEYKSIRSIDLKMLSISGEFETFFNLEEIINIKLFIKSFFNNGNRLSTKELFKSIPRIGAKPDKAIIIDF
jgi:hypothetical protein